MGSEVQENKWFILKEDINEKQLKINIYQIFTRLFGNKTQKNIEWGSINENGVGKFNDITEIALEKIKELGITHIWYTGIIEHALLTDYSHYNIPLDHADVVKGRAGSPYAIKDYYDVNPDLAVDVENRIQEFENLVDRTHNQNLKVIIDFVPNHVARQYHSDSRPGGVEDLGEKDDLTKRFHSENNFYYLVGHEFIAPDFLNKEEINLNKDGHYYENPAKATGNDCFTNQPGVNDWFETIKLNYGVDYENNSHHFSPIPSTWKKMRDILLYWVGKNVDGFRCDMAEMVPVEFWSWVIPEVKKVNPEIIFIAEIYNPQQYHNYIFNGKFDFLYDKVQLYDALRNIMTHNGTCDQLTGIWQFLRGINKNMLRFLENHDEQRIASRFFASDQFKAIPAFTVSAYLYSSPLMIYFGQEAGEPGEGKSGFSSDDGRTTIFDYWGVPEHQKWMNEGKFDGGMLDENQKIIRNFYKELLNLKLEHEALYRGSFIDLHSINKNLQNYNYPENIYSFLRYTTKEQILVIVNFNNKFKKANIYFPKEIFKFLQLDNEKQYEWDLIFSNEKSKGLNLTLELSESNDFKISIDCSKYGSYVYKIIKK